MSDVDPAAGGMAERFAVGAGRPRPPYQPKTIQCPGCGAGQTIKDEHARLAICASCGRRLELTAAELKVIGGRRGEAYDFPFAIGDRFRHDDVGYEVVARMALQETDEPNEALLRQYLLFHPRRGSAWLSEWAGNWDLTRATHVMPVESPFKAGKGELVETHDGRSWRKVETVEYTVLAVDGALPWVARVGDTTLHAELAAADGSDGLYEVEHSRQRDEYEYGRGRRLSHHEVGAAAGRDDLPGAKVEVENVVATAKSYQSLLKLCALALALNALLWLVASAKGRQVLAQQFAATELAAADTFSQPFEVARGGITLKAKLYAPDVDNSWTTVNLAVVRGDDTVVHLADEDIEYYHGVEGGESWREGSRKAVSYFRLPEAGTYRLLLRTEGTGSALRVELVAGAVQRVYFGLMVIVTLMSLGYVAFRYFSWRSGSEDDDDD